MHENQNVCRAYSAQGEDLRRSWKHLRKTSGNISQPQCLQTSFAPDLWIDKEPAFVNMRHLRSATGLFAPTKDKYGCTEMDNVLVWGQSLSVRRAFGIASSDLVAKSWSLQ